MTEIEQTETWALVLASGSGERFGSQKHVALLAGQRLVDRAVETAWAVCDRVVVAVATGEQWEGDQRCLVVSGGESRLESSKAALAAVPSKAGRVLIHDAAHPLASVALARRVLESLGEGIDAVVPVYPLADALVRVEGERVTASVSKEGLMSLQMPQAFRPKVLQAAHALCTPATDDGSLVIALGFAVQSVPGEATNLHIATREDLAVAETLASEPKGA
jgi:2-C-methyl-D-erythritol 4-phosphate cytidylyltransferase